MVKILSFDVGIINLAYCVFDTDLCKILFWEVINLENHNSSYNKLYINLINELDKRKQCLLDVNLVLIEKQPSFNPKMRIIAGCLQTYFFIRGVVDAPLGHDIKNVEFFSPKHKLKCYTGPPLLSDSKNKSKYSQTKKMGVLITYSKLEEFNEPSEIKDIFEKSKKKDDLADCYLQAVTYSVFKKLIKTGQPVIIEKREKSLTKTEIKKQLKEILTSKMIKPTEIPDDNNLAYQMEILPPLLKQSIKEKYPEQTLETLFTAINLKVYLKSYFCK